MVLKGRIAIAAYFGIEPENADYFFRKHGHELKDTGVVFYRVYGRPKKRAMFAFPENLRLWQMLKTQKGEKI